MKNNILLITGGTGGHVIPAKNFANYLINKNIKCKIILDRRGYKYINDFSGNINTIHASNLSGTIISKTFGLIHLLVGFIQSFVLVLLYKPTIVISFGSYAAFFPMLSCLILKFFFKTKLFIHEQNSIIGRTNNFFLMFADKIFLNFNTSLNVNIKFQNKFHIVGYPQKENKKFNLDKNIDSKKNFSILIYGGSQGSEFISNFSSKLIKQLNAEKKIKAKFIFQCPKNMLRKIKNDLKNINSEICIKDYFDNIDEILNETNIAISRAGAGSISDLIIYKIPSILIPLPNAKDNHQFHNASLLQKHELAIILDQDEIEYKKAKNYIYEIYNIEKKVKYIKNNFNKISIRNTNSLIYKLITDEK